MTNNTNINTCFVIIMLVNSISCGEYDTTEEVVGVFLNKEDAQKVVDNYNKDEHFEEDVESSWECTSKYLIKEMPLNGIKGE